MKSFTEQMGRRRIVWVYTRLSTSCGNYAESIPNIPKGLSTHGTTLVSDHSRGIFCKELSFLLLYHSLDTFLVNLVENFINSKTRLSNLTDLSRT